MPATSTLTPASQGKLQLASGNRLQVNVTYDQTLAVQPTAEWATVFDIIDFVPGAPEYQKAATGLVQTSQRKVSQTRSLTGSRLRVKHSDPNDNAGWLALSNASRLNKLAQVRWYNAADTDEPGEIAIVDVTYSKQGGGPADRGVDQFTLELMEIAQSTANPSGTAVLPNATTATPNTGPAGTTVVIAGTGFLGTTGAGGVKFGSTNAALYTVDSGTQITAVVPTGGAAGPQNILVTNTAGADSTPVTFTKS